MTSAEAAFEAAPRVADRAAEAIAARPPRPRPAAPARGVDRRAAITPPGRPAPGALFIAQNRARPLAGATVRTAPAAPGLYVLFRDGRPVYVGEADNLRRRLGQHLLCHTNVRDPLLPSYTFGEWVPPDAADANARWGYETWLIGNYPQFFRHQTKFLRRKPAREAEALAEADRKLDRFLDRALGPPGPEYAHRPKVRSTGSRARTKGKHQAGEARDQAAARRVAQDERQRRAAARRKWEERALRLTGMARPTAAVIVGLIADAEGRIADLTRQADAARSAGDATLFRRLDADRGDLVARVQELRAFRLEL